MMIKNSQQYQNSLDWLQRFEQSIAELDNNEQLKAEPERWKLHRDSYQSQVDELKLEIAEYERLINCDTSKPLKIKVDSLNRLPNALIKILTHYEWGKTGKSEKWEIIKAFRFHFFPFPSLQKSIFA